MTDELLRREFLLAVGGIPALAGSAAAELSQGPAVVPAAGKGRFRERIAAGTPLFIRDRARKDMVFPFTPAAAASKRLDELKDAGIDLVEVYAPAHGGNSFLGLDTIDRYEVDPRAGTMDDFKRLVDLAHRKGMWIISIDNFGYASVDAIDFLKACDDVRAKRDSREARFFVWSESADAPPPGIRGDRYFMVRPTHLPGGGPGGLYDSSKHEFWQWSERANRFYWTKWDGVDLAGRKVRLPQFNWGSPELVDEMEKVVRFWMDTGIDGIMIDAVNWYVGCDWGKNRRAMTDAIASYGDKYCQPEGGGRSATTRSPGSPRGGGRASRTTVWGSTGRRAATSSRTPSRAATRVPSSGRSATTTTASSTWGAPSITTRPASRTRGRRTSRRRSWRLSATSWSWPP